MSSDEEDVNSYQVSDISGERQSSNVVFGIHYIVSSPDSAHEGETGEGGSAGGALGQERGRS